MFFTVLVSTLFLVIQSSPPDPNELESLFTWSSLDFGPEYLTKSLVGILLHAPKTLCTEVATKGN